MDENTPSIDTSQKIKPNYWKIAFFIVSFLMIASNGLWFYIIQTQSDNVNNTLTKKAPVTTTVNPSPFVTITNNSNSRPLELLSLTNSEKLYLNQTYKILWKNQDLEIWVDEIVVCLIGFDSNDKEIVAKSEWNEQLCTYRSGDLNGSYLVAKTKLSSGGYDWNIPNDLFNRFVSQPIKFKIRLLVFDNLPAQGRSEWAGNLGWDDSKDFLLIGNSP